MRGTPPTDKTQKKHTCNSIYFVTYLGLDGRRRQRRHNGHPSTIGRMGHLEIKGQMVPTPKNSWIPPTPIHQKGHSRGLLGIQDQRVVSYRGHPGQKAKEDIRMLGEKQVNNTTRSTGSHDNGTPDTQSQLRQRRICD